MRIIHCRIYLFHSPKCSICLSFPLQMVTMTHCSCTFCESCFKKYFSSVIKEKNIVHIVCPLCNLPDVRGGRREESMEYFSLLDTQVWSFFYLVPDSLKYRPYEIEYRIWLTVNVFVSVDQVLFRPRDPWAFPEEAQRPGTARNAQLPLVCTCKFHHSQIIYNDV